MSTGPYAMTGTASPLYRELMKLAAAMFSLGRAVEKGDVQAARKADIQARVALGRAMTEARYPHP